MTNQAGTAAYPIDYVYDSNNGWLNEMCTYTTTVAPANAKKTYWLYDAATGLVLHIKDHNLNATSYTYYPGRRLLQTRLWQRTVPIAGTPRLTTTYSYDKGGLLSKVEYNDGTPMTTVTYDHAGRKTGAVDAVGSWTYTLSDAAYVTNESISSAASSANLLNGFYVTRTKDTYGRRSSVYASGSACTASGMIFSSRTGRLSGRRCARVSRFLPCRVVFFAGGGTGASPSFPSLSSNTSPKSPCPSGTRSLLRPKSWRLSQSSCCWSTAI